MLKPALRRRRVLAAITAALAAIIAIVGATIVVATPASAATSWLAVSAGRLSTCAIDSNRDLYCWGANYDGQLGLGHLNSTPIPSRVPAGNSDWATVSVGDTHACATRTNNKGYCWGANTYNGDGTHRNGKLGLGSSVYIEMSPTQVPDIWASISAGNEHTCGIHAGGQLWCWGENGFGELGLGHTKTRFTPTLTSTIGWHAVSVGMAHTCGHNFSQRTRCWGSTNRGQVGTGIMATEDNVLPTVLEPAPIEPNTRDWKANTVGGNHSCSIQSTGVLWCWGQNTSGQLGQGTRNNQSTPQPLGGNAGDYSDWSSVSGGHDHTCAIRTNGQLWCWGENANGQIGVDDRSDHLYAKTVKGTWGSVDGGRDHTCAIKTGRQLYCWGDNSWGQLGLGNYTDHTTPARIP